MKSPINRFAVLPRYTRLRRFARIRPVRSKPRPGVIRDPAYRAWIHTQPCLVHGWACGSIEMHHVHDVGGPRNDRRGVPLCPILHREGPDAVHTIHQGPFEARFGMSFEAAIARLNDEYQGITSFAVNF
jgi:hypothetical protein